MASNRTLWSREETIVALDLAAKLDSVYQAQADATAVMELSRLLRGPGNPPVKHRNPFGVACKLVRLSQLIHGQKPQGGALMEKASVEEFAGRRDALAAEAAAVRQALHARFTMPTRGPVPFFGEALGWREDGEAFVYLAVLTGVLLADGRLVAKIGRSTDVGRRMQELNTALPGAIGINWQARTTWRFIDGASAHEAEQTMLAHWAARGWSIGGEYFAVDSEGLKEIEGGRSNRRTIRHRTARGARSRLVSGQGRQRYCG